MPAEFSRWSKVTGVESLCGSALVSMVKPADFRHGDNPAQFRRFNRWDFLCGGCRDIFRSRWVSVEGHETLGSRGEILLRGQVRIRENTHDAVYAARKYYPNFWIGIMAKIREALQ